MSVKRTQAELIRHHEDKLRKLRGQEVMRSDTRVKLALSIGRSLRRLAEIAIEDEHPYPALASAAEECAERIDKEAFGIVQLKLAFEAMPTLPAGTVDLGQLDTNQQLLPLSQG